MGSAPFIRVPNDLFHKVMKFGCGRQPMRRRHPTQVGYDAAVELGLEEPGNYTGHCFRTSSATAAVNQESTAVDLKRHFGWVHNRTALDTLMRPKRDKWKMAKICARIHLTDNDENTHPEVPHSVDITKALSTKIVHTILLWNCGDLRVYLSWNVHSLLFVDCFPILHTWGNKISNE